MALTLGRLVAAALLGVLVCDGARAAPPGASESREGTPTPAPPRRPGDVATTVRVELVLLDLLALDAKDRPVLDLDAKDFQVTIGGKPQPIEAFEPPPRPALAAASAAGPELLAGSTQPAVPDGRPPLHLLFVIDGEELTYAGQVTAGTHTLELARRATAPRVSLVEHLGRNAVRLWEEVAVEAMEGELRAIAREPTEKPIVDTRVVARDVSTRPGSEPVPRELEKRRRYESALVRRVVEAEHRARSVIAAQEESARRMGDEDYRGTAQPDAVLEAYQELSSYLAGERLRVRESVRELRATLERFAALGDRRQAVVFTQGFARVPGAHVVQHLDWLRAAMGKGPAFDALRDAPRAAAPELMNARNGFAAHDGSAIPELAELQAWLAESGVILHVIDPTAGVGLRDASLDAIAASRDAVGDAYDLHASATRLAEPTGGLMRSMPGGIGSFADVVSSSYRIAVRVTDVEPAKVYAVKVTSRRNGVRVRTRSAFRAGGTPRPANGGRVEEILRASRRDAKRPGAARLAASRLPLTAVWKGKRGRFHVLEARVPHDALRFKPENDAMVASAKIVVKPVAIGGAPLETVEEDIFLAFTGEEYREAHGTDLVRAVRLELAPGKYELTVTIEDSLAESAGVTSLIVDAEP